MESITKKQSLSSRQKAQLNQLGLNVGVARKLRGLSQEELGVRARLSRQVIANLENGTPVKTSSLLSVLFVLGLDWQLIDAIALENDGVGLRIVKSKQVSIKHKKITTPSGSSDEF